MSRKERRVAMLENVYDEFDLDGGGDVGADEMLALGKARRALGQKSGEWTEAHNERMLEKMGADQNGNVVMDRFVKHFNESLPFDDDEFSRSIEQFLECARSLNQQKELARSQQSEHATPVKANNEQKVLTPAEKKENTRNVALCRVFQQFDLDNSGQIEKKELLQLGKARRKLGQKTSVWSEAKNAKLVNKMDVDRNGTVSEQEFTRHFTESLPKDKKKFDEAIAQFMEVAREYRVR